MHRKHITQFYNSSKFNAFFAFRWFLLIVHVVFLCTSIDAKNVDSLLRHRIFFSLVREHLYERDYSITISVVEERERAKLRDTVVRC